MKHLLLTLTLTLLTLTVTAQTDHLKFNGIPIDGTLQTFSSALCKKGYTYVQRDNNMGIFTGTFTGRSVTVAVLSSDINGNVYRVGVRYPDMDSWQLLENLYNGLKDLLTTKYGAPFSVVEEVSERYLENDKMNALALDKIIWETTFVTPQGKIWVSIKRSGYSSGHVFLLYEDETNGNATYDSYLDEL